jgi:polar amino acid transport system substrate-binding protein
MSLIRYKKLIFDYIPMPKRARLFIQLIFISVGVLYTFNSTIAVAEPLKITLAAEDSWPPFADEVGNGISHNLIRQAFKQVDVDVSTIVVPYTRGLIMTERGSVDGVFNVTKEQSTINRFIFGNEPLFTVTASFFFAKEHPTIADNKWQIPIKSTIGIVSGMSTATNLRRLLNSCNYTSSR